MPTAAQADCGAITDAGTSTAPVAPRPQPAQDVAAGCVGSTRAGMAQRKEGAEEPPWVPGVAAWPPRAWWCFLQRAKCRGSAPGPVAERLRWQAQPSTAPVTQTQGHTSTCKHPKGDQRDEFSQDRDIRHKSWNSSIFSRDKQNGLAGRGFSPIPRCQGLQTVTMGDLRGADGGTRAKQHVWSKRSRWHRCGRDSSLAGGPLEGDVGLPAARTSLTQHV